MLPAILPRAPGFNAYTHFGVRTRRGVKAAAKLDWAARVLDYWVDNEYVGANANVRSVISGAKEEAAYKAGWLIGGSCLAVTRAIDNSDTDVNSGLAQAYKRFNYHIVKYTKKSYITTAVGMIDFSPDGNQMIAYNGTQKLGDMILTSQLNQITDRWA
jgi:hypothetical protein